MLLCGTTITTNPKTYAEEPSQVTTQQQEKGVSGEVDLRFAPSSPAKRHSLQSVTYTYSPETKTLIYTVKVDPYANIEFGPTKDNIYIYILVLAWVRTRQAL
ncbi:hypothetical protein D3X11_03810 [Streptococcus sp. X16XC17]|nr:hypothetical protein D3X11_03810 [Streptococcus sp. X16XC17]